MLIGFTVENYRSFFGEASLSMIATNDKEHRMFNVASASHDDLLKNVLIYGANASGKSNLLSAMYFMQKMITSSIDTQTEHIKTCQAFTFREDTANLPTKFKMSLLLDDVVYDYGFDILNAQISREYLYKKVKRRTLVFERTSPEFDSIKLSADMSDAEPLKKNVRCDVLFLSWASYTNNALAIKIVNWIASKLVILGVAGQKAAFKTYIDDLVKSLIRKADNDILEMKWHASKKELLSTHKVYDENWAVKHMIDVPFEDYASAGTKRMLELSDVLYKALTEASVIAIDDFDLHLHPQLVRYLIAIFNSVEHNPQNAQLICTTYDVLLLDEDIRRDQIWFVDKNEYGASHLYALSDFKDVRKNSDLLKRYLLGVYGAIPTLNRVDGDL